MGNEKELAIQALELFKARDYERAIQILNQVKQEKGENVQDDPKIQHNILVTLFSLGQMEPKQFIDELGKLKKKVEEKNQNEKDGENKSLGISDTYIMVYNQALIYFKLKKFNESLVLLEPVYQSIKPIDDYVAIKICFLMIEIYFALHLLEKISPIITYLEKNISHFIQTKENEENHIGDSSQGKEEEKYQNSISPNLLSNQINLYKTRFHLVSGNYESASKEIESLQSSVPESHVPLFLEANLEYLQKDFQKSIKVLNSIQLKSPKLEALYYNNLACIHFKMKKYTMSAFYFTKALKSNQKFVQSLGIFLFNQNIYFWRQRTVCFYEE